MNGQPVTADDVLFTIDQMRGAATSSRRICRIFGKKSIVVKLDKKVLQFRLPAPFAPFPDYLIFWAFAQTLAGWK